MKSEHGMRGMVCWDAVRTEEVLQIEALQDRVADFLATHRPPRIWQRSSLVDDSTRQDSDQSRMLRELLTPPDFAFVPIVGDVGTGKSHLVRWLFLHVPRSEHRRVLLIPKINTNLRSVLLRIIEGMSGEPFDSFRAKVSQAAESVSDAVAAEELLNALSVACGRNSHSSIWPDGRDGLPSDVAEYFKDVAPVLLQDPVFRKFFLSDQGPIVRLVGHAFGRNQTVVDIEERQQFALDDLPATVSGITEASKAARDAWENIGFDSDTRKQFIVWLNVNFDAAVRRVLNLGREDLAEVMLELRRELNRRHQELVILFEDFAKQQGIERELLESLLVFRRQEGGAELCPIRTVLACTSGYFRSLQDTVGERVTFYVDLDAPPGVKDKRSTDPAEFASRYLNAVRHRGQELEEWYNEERAADLDASLLTNPPEPPPSACARCDCKKRCHVAFGHIDGYGLYPFTAAALRNLSRRVSGERFNPRKLIINVLKRTLQNDTESLRAGGFPPDGFTSGLPGTGRLSTPARQRIADQDPSCAGRRTVFLDVWSDWDGNGPVPDLPDAVHEAFGLPKLGERTIEHEVIKEKEEEETQPVNKDPEPQLPESLTQFISELDTWAQNQEHRLSQAVVGKLREVLFRPLQRRVPWDSELILNEDNNRRGLIEQRDINFAPQAVKENADHLKLVIPVHAQERVEAAYGCQGLLLWNHHGGWRFPNGAAYQRRAARCLEVWSEELLSQVRKTRFGGKRGYDPVPAATELLALGHRLLNRPVISKSGDLIALTESLFEAYSDTEPPPGRGPAWSRLCREFKKQRAGLVAILRSRLACTKGQAKALQMIDASQLIEPLRRFRRNGRAVEAIPEELVNDPFLKVLLEFRSVVDDTLAAAISEERELLIERAKAVTNELGPTPDVDALCSELAALAAAGAQAGLLGQPMIQRFNDVDKVKTNKLREAILAVARIAENDPPKDGTWSVGLLDEVSRDLGLLLTIAATMLETAKPIIVAVEEGSRLSQPDAVATKELTQLQESLSRLLKYASDAATWASS